MLWRKVLENNASVAFVPRQWLSRGKLVTESEGGTHGPNSDCILASDNLFLAILNIWDFLVSKLQAFIPSSAEDWNSEIRMPLWVGMEEGTLPHWNSQLILWPLLQKCSPHSWWTQDLVTSQRPCSNAITWNQGSNRQSLAGEKYLSIINPNSRHQSLQICGTRQAT